MSTTPLDYARPTPSKRRRIILRTITTLSLAAALIAITYNFPRLYFNYRMWTAIRSSLTYTAPPNQVVYDEDPARGQSLRAADPSAYRFFSVGSPGYNDFTARVAPPVADGPHQLTIGPCPVFLHARRASPTSPLRLVAIHPPTNGARPTAAAGAPPHNQVRIPALIVSVRGTAVSDTLNRRLTRDPVYLVPPEEAPALTEGRPTPLYLRLYAGQPDPADESHFTLRYDLGGRTGTLHARLQPNDTVKFTAEPDPVATTRPAK